MLIPCPICGPRDIREFTYKGHIAYMHRPESETWSDDWNDYLHDRENPAGKTHELWHHTAGCGAWLVVERNTVTHEITGAWLASEKALEMRNAG